METVELIIKSNIKENDRVSSLSFSLSQLLPQRDEVILDYLCVCAPLLSNGTDTVYLWDFCQKFSK